MTTVLVIDDEEELRHVARISLGVIGKMTVLEASSGEEGIARAKAEQPDVILLDIMMPLLDGAMTFRALKADAETAHIPVIFLTAQSVPDVAFLLDLGAKGVIRKPFDPLTLPHQIAAILAR